jgi:hypothetical protein
MITLSMADSSMPRRLRKRCNEKTPHCYHLVTLKSACRLQLFAAGAGVVTDHFHSE